MKNIYDILVKLKPGIPSDQSSRPRELPPQPLTDTDMNLSIHPAPIVQSRLLKQTASVQKVMASSFVFGSPIGLRGIDAL